MPRARNIKHSFFTNDELAENNEPLGRLLFAGLWTLADCNGNLEWRKSKVKAQVLPYDNCDVEKLAINLDKSGFIRFYSDGEILYCHILEFVKHQNPHKNERDAGGKVPAYSEDMRQLADLKGLQINLDKSGLKRNLHHTDPADSLFLNPDSLNLKPDSKESCPATPDDPPPKKPTREKFTNEINIIFKAWCKSHDKKNTTFLTPRRIQTAKAALKMGYSVDRILLAIEGIKTSDHHMGRNAKTNFTKYNDLTNICKPENIEKFSEVKTVFAENDLSESELHEKEMRRKLGLDGINNTIEGEFKNV
jgi:hypothetical protein